MSSEKPEYQKKIVVASLMAPAGFMRNFRNPVLFPLLAMYRGILVSELNSLYHFSPIYYLFISPQKSMLGMNTIKTSRSF